MSLIEEVTNFLSNADLPSYCINAYITLLKATQPTLAAKEIVKDSGVPIGRIYDVLDELELKGMVKILDSRPKQYQALPLNRALYNVISYQTRENQRKVAYLYETAQILEAKFHDSELKRKIEPAKVFYSTVIGTKEIIPLYLKYFNEVQEEILVSLFVNETTPQVLSLGKNFFESLAQTLTRGVEVKMLWSFQYDDRPLSKELIKKNEELLEKISAIHSEYGLTTEKGSFQVKYVLKKPPNYYDILDQKRVILKLQNPSTPWRIFASLNIVDPTLAGELRKKFLNMWNFNALELS